MKENQRIALTKRLLKEALLRLLEHKELSRIHVSELCQEAGINRATFYRHYDTPADVLLELEQELVKKLTTLSARPKNPEEAQKSMEAVCEAIYQQRDVVKILFRCHSDADFELRVQSLVRRLWELRREQLPDPQPDEGTMQAVTAMLCGGFYCLLRQWILLDIPKTPAQIAAIACHLIRWPGSQDVL